MFTEEVGVVDVEIDLFAKDWMQDDNDTLH